MARIILFILLSCCLYTQAMAQQPSNTGAYIYYEKGDNGWAIVAKRNFVYDSSSRLAEAIDLDKKGEEWQERRKSVYQYPSDSLRIELNSGEEGSSRDVYVLDSKGREIAARFENYDSVAQNWTANVKGIYSKDKSGNISEKKYLRYKDGQWNNEDRTLFTYDDAGNATEEVFQMWENGAWVTHQKDVHHYNSDNTIAYTDIFNQDKSSPTPGTLQAHADARHLYTYDRDGKLIEWLVQKFSNGKWEDEFKRVSILNKLPKTKKKAHQKDKKGKGQQKTQPDEQ